MDPTLLALLVQLMSADSSGASKGTNTMQDALFSMLLDPSFGVLTGTYDPMLTVQPVPDDSYAASPEVGMPITMSYINGGGKMAEIAQGLLGGQLTFDQALRDVENATADENSELFGQDLTDLKDELSTLRTEINDYAAKAAEAQYNAAQVQPRTDKYAEMGLPLPQEQYTPDTMSRDEASTKRRQELDKLTADLAQRMAALGEPDMVSSRVAGRRGSPSINAKERPEPDGSVPQPRTEYRMEWDPSWQTPANGRRGISAGPTNPYRLVPYTVKPTQAEITAAQKNAPMWQMIDPKWMDKKKQLEYEQKKIEIGQRQADAYDEGRAIGMQVAGRSPYSDAVAERTKQLAPLLALFLSPE